MVDAGTEGLFQSLISSSWTNDEDFQQHYHEKYVKEYAPGLLTIDAYLTFQLGLIFGTMTLGENWELKNS